MTAILPTPRVADLMTLDPVVVAADATLEEAESLMRDHRVTGLPVVDGAGRLVGVISQTDLLFLAVSSVRSLIRHRTGTIRVGEVMSTPPVTIDAAARLTTAAEVMSRDRIHRLVVVDAAERPIGVLSAMDFVDLAAEG